MPTINYMELHFIDVVSVMEIEAVDESSVSFSDSDVSTNRLLHERSMLIYQVLHTHLLFYFINEIPF
jgi:hypothetical protein